MDVAIYVKTSLAAVPSSVQTDLIENNEKINKAHQDITDDKSHVLITGDFYYPDLYWQSGASPPDAENKDTTFMEAVRDAFLFQNVTDPTNYRGDHTLNTLDLILSNEDNMVKELQYTAPLGKRHYQVLHFQYTCYLDAPVSGNKR